MLERNRKRVTLAAMVLAVCISGTATPVGAQIIDETFDTVTGTGGSTFFTGAGFALVHNWDNGITGESAFAGTTGNTKVGGVSAAGVTTGGVGGTGGGRVQVTNANFNVLDQRLDTVTGVGGGVFLAPTGAPDTSGYTASWDNGVTGESAFGGTFGGAIVVGGMSAQGVPTGGMGGTGGGQLTVSNINVTSGHWYAGLAWAAGPLPGASPLYNPGFDDGGGSFSHWTKFGNAYVEAITPHSGTHVCKIFGTWGGAWNASGVTQDMAGVAGQVWEINCYSRHNSGDSLVGTLNYAVMKMEFWSAGGQKILEQESTVINASSPLDTWIENTPLQVTAPSGTATVRAAIVFLQPNFQGGAALIDSVTCRPISGTPTVDLSSLTLTANIKGTANSGAGEVLGDVQLRLEDTDGDRLVFYGTATGGWQSIGGALNSATEADAAGIATSGVFNPHSPSFTVVVAFDDERTTRWGTGGTLAVDNVLLGNTNPAGSSWYAGLFWENLSLTAGDPNRLFLSADVRGDHPGGEYALRVEGFRLGSSGLDEDFDAVTGTGGGLFLDYDLWYNGGGAKVNFQFTNNWDDGLTGEGAYGGLSGTAEIYYDGVYDYGFSARGLTTGGLTGTGGGEIRVEGIIFGPGDTWYAGLNWPDQALASTTLSEVTLTADIKGEIASYGTLGDYELRIEDAQGDRLYFQSTATGDWQHIGGALSTALQGPALSGSGDGVFNLDSSSYAVVVAFRNETTTWQYGGVLKVDNLYLTPVTTKTQLGALTFTGTANGSFQEVGGLLSLATSTFPGDLDESFNAVTGAGGGAFLLPGQSNGATDGWDTGIVREHAFAGTWGDAVVVGSVSAQGCTTCGFNGTGGGQIVVSDIQPNAGGWWAGLNWSGYAIDTRDLSQVYLTADVRGAVDAGAGQTLGPYQLRIEDDGNDYLAFNATATGSWQSIGGPLSTATLGTISGGDGIFNLNAASYTVTLVFSGNATDWGRGGTLTIDNIYLTGITFGDADSYTATLTFANEVDTWGTSGTLTVDNLLFAPAANCDDDFDVDLADFARFQRCLSGSGPVPSGCECADLDGDGHVNLTDYALFDASFRGPRG